jgi:hypothetical protein
VCKWSRRGVGPTQSPTEMSDGPRSPGIRSLGHEVSLMKNCYYSNIFGLTRQAETCCCSCDSCQHCLNGVTHIKAGACRWPGTPILCSRYQCMEVYLQCPYAHRELFLTVYICCVVLTPLPWKHLVFTQLHRQHCQTNGKHAFTAST